MADKAISELNPVTTVTGNDNFVLEQNNAAMRLTGQVLLNWLAHEMDAHGGIRTIAKTATDVLEDTYTITFSDETTWDFKVTNGRSIDNIQKTGTSVLIDTYTITFNDNTSTTFDVANGNGITDLRKTGTSGLVDTYTVFFSDGSYFSYNVDNGNGIVGIAKTSTNVLVDTYTITFTNGTTTTFNITNGNGIENIQKTRTNLLEDTYTITYTGGSSTTFVVNNGRSIVNVENTSTSGLVDTYTITYNDETSSTFTVTNGEKGDNTYTWVKYSANQPTRDSDMTDTPSAWIGFYWGSSSTAPTHYTSYSWYRMKGDTGDDLTVKSTHVQYGTSATEEDTPTQWSDTMPTVRPGYYLWSKTVIIYMDDSESAPIYMKTRWGRDGGGGNVLTVNGISPDSDGDIGLITVQGTMLIIKEGA